MRLNASRILAWTGAVILAATAAFHFTGYESAAAASIALKDETQLAAALPPLWLFPTMHWGALSLIAIAASFSTSGLARFLLIAMALLIGADAAMLFHFIGPFIGEAMLAGSAILFAAAALFMRK